VGVNHCATHLRDTTLDAIGANFTVDVKDTGDECVGYNIWNSGFYEAGVEVSEFASVKGLQKHADALLQGRKIWIEGN